jgi:hypothetical protein
MLTRSAKKRQLRLNSPTPVIVISRKLFCLIIIGLATLAAASVCSLMHLSMDSAVILFLSVWVGLIALFEISGLFNGDSHALRETPRDR